MRILIIGCGYLGIAVGRRLRDAGHEVFGLRRSAAGAAELLENGIKPLTGNILEPESLRQLPRNFAGVINTVSSSRGDASVYQQIYWEGTKNVMQYLRDSECSRFAYTSSTSVYGQQDGSWVTEDSPTAPTAPTARILVATEQELINATPPLPGAVGIFRVAGIYGPQRGHLYRQFLDGTARIQGDGSRLINMIHRDDAAAALQAFMEAPALPDGPRVYNVCDDAPVTQLEFFTWLSQQLHRPLPPTVTEADAAPSKRGQTQKRVCNRRLREELGWHPQYPTFRTGYAALMDA